MKKLWLCVITALVATLAACGGGKSSNVSGTWSYSFTGGGDSGKTGSFTLTQAPGSGHVNVTGTVMYNGTSVPITSGTSNTGGGSFSFNASLSSVPGCLSTDLLNFMGGVNGKSMSGSYIDNCTVSSGTFTATEP